MQKNSEKQLQRSILCLFNCVQKSYTRNSVYWWKIYVVYYHHTIVCRLFVSLFARCICRIFQWGWNVMINNSIINFLFLNHITSENLFFTYARSDLWQAQFIYIYNRSPIDTWDITLGMRSLMYTVREQQTWFWYSIKQ